MARFRLLKHECVSYLFFINFILLLIISSILRLADLPIPSPLYQFSAGFFIGTYIDWGKVSLITLIKLGRARRYDVLDKKLFPRILFIISFVLFIFMGISSAYIEQQVVGNAYLIFGIFFGSLLFEFGIGKFISCMYEIKKT